MQTVKYLANLFQTKQKFTSGYHSQTNGLTEGFNRTITNELAKVVNERKDNLPNWLQARVFAYNTTVQYSTGYSPFELIHTYLPRTSIDNELAKPPAPESLKKKEWAEEVFKKAQIMGEDALRNQRAAESQKERIIRQGVETNAVQCGGLCASF